MCVWNWRFSTAGNLVFSQFHTFFPHLGHIVLLKLLIQTSKANYNLAAVNCTAAFILNFRNGINKKTSFFIYQIFVCFHWFLFEVPTLCCLQVRALPRFWLHQICFPLMLFFHDGHEKRQIFLACFVVQDWQKKHCSPGLLTTHQDSWPLTSTWSSSFNKE